MLSLCHCLQGNLTEHEQAQILEEVCQVAYHGVFPCLLCLAIVTNCINAAVLSRTFPRLNQSTPARTYLFWLAVCQFLICMVLIIATFVGRRNLSSYHIAFYFAHIEQPLYSQLNCTSAFIILGVSWDRYKAVCYPHNYSVTKGCETAPKKVALAYIASFCMYIPHLFYEAPKYDGDRGVWFVAHGSIWNPVLWKVWTLIVQTFHRILSSLILVYLNIKILFAMIALSKTRDLVCTTTNSKRRGSHRERQIIYLLLALTLSFLLTNVPSALMKIVTSVHGHCQLSFHEEVARAVVNCIEMMGYSIDFFLYFFMNSDYRLGLKNIFKSTQSLLKYASRGGTTVMEKESENFPAKRESKCCNNN